LVFSCLCLCERDIVYHNRNFFIPKIIVVFRTDLHKMSYAAKDTIF
jgi:hypothetical protein